MLVLLPPSEGKASGGTGANLQLDRLSFPALTPVRARLVSALARLAVEQPDGLRLALGLSGGQSAALAANTALTTSGTLPALRRYTGVLYDALDYPALRGTARGRADRSLVVASALFGLLRPRDRIPDYRLSGGSVLPGVGGLGALWRPVVEPELAAVRGLVVDLRSGVYAGLARVPNAVEVRVLREQDGRRSVVSHDNKYAKGQLARVLCERGAHSLQDVAEAGRSVADDVEIEGRRIDLLLHGLARQRASIAP